MVFDIWLVWLSFGAMGWSVVSDMWPVSCLLVPWFGLCFLICGLCRYLLVPWFGLCSLLSVRSVV